MAGVGSKILSEYSHENGGRVLLLFLLFLLAIYEFSTAGFSAFAIICCLPLLVLFIYAAFTWRMFTFWTLVVVNYFLQMKDVHLPIPISVTNELIQIILLAMNCCKSYCWPSPLLIPDKRRILRELVI